MEFELLVRLASRRRFIVETTRESDAATQARKLLDHGATERLEGEAFTIHPARQIVSVTVQKAGTGTGTEVPEGIELPLDDLTKEPPPPR
jgi:hypothetical protein